jgi:hypothetical protein
LDQIIVSHGNLQVQDSKSDFTVLEAYTSSKVQCTGHFPIADGPALSVLHFIPGPGGSRFYLATSYISVFVLGENMILTDAQDSCERTSQELSGRRNRKGSLKCKNLIYSQILAKS